MHDAVCVQVVDALREVTGQFDPDWPRQLD